MIPVDPKKKSGGPILFFSVKFFRIFLLIIYFTKLIIEKLKLVLIKEIVKKKKIDVQRSQKYV